MEKDIKKDVYEVGYLIIPTVAEENVGAIVTELKDMLVKKGSEFISDEYPKMIDLAYEMTKTIANKKQRFMTGYFGWVKFETSKEAILEVKEALDHNDSLIRFMIIKTVRESTMAQSPKRVFGAKKRHTSSKVEETEEGEKQEIDEKTIDQDIDALVVE